MAMIFKQECVWGGKMNGSEFKQAQRREGSEDSEEVIWDGQMVNLAAEPVFPCVYDPRLLVEDKCERMWSLRVGQRWEDRFWAQEWQAGPRALIPLTLYKSYQID